MRGQRLWAGIAGLTSLACAGLATATGGAGFFSGSYSFLTDGGTDVPGRHRCLAECDGEWVNTGATCADGTHCCGWYHCPSGLSQHTCCYPDQECVIPINDGSPGIPRCEVVP